MRSADNSAQVVRVLDPVEHDQKLRRGRDVLEFGIAGRRAQSDHTLMRFDAGHAIERRTLLETNGSM